MHEVTVTSLPHPISMFLLGFFLLAITLLYREYVSLVRRLKEQDQEISKLEAKIEKHIDHVDEKIAFITKKIDSRVDKALLGLKK
jgi:uncharacterized protein YbcC (UPF0753/DUF2309 family)